MWIGKKKFSFYEDTVTRNSTDIEKALNACFNREIAEFQSLITGVTTYRYKDGDSSKIDLLNEKLDLLLKELGYEYKPETQTKEPAKLVKTIGKSKRAKK
jgi:hypothetical protein